MSTRTEPYRMERSLPEPLPGEPFGLLTDWYERQQRRRDQPNPNAMTLATASADGEPAARIVLCRGIEPDPGYFVFFTNRQSVKGEHLTENPSAALLFHWDHEDLQVRVEGPVTVSPERESDDYWRARRFESRIGSHASDQSRPLNNRDEMLERIEQVCRRFGVDPETLTPEKDIPRPEHWGGYRVWAASVELWIGGPGRVHERARWTRSLTAEGEGFRAGAWSATRLQP